MKMKMRMRMKSVNLRNGIVEISPQYACALLMMVMVVIIDQNHHHHQSKMGTRAPKAQKTAIHTCRNHR